MSENNIYQHFRSEEKTLIDLVLDWKYRVEETYTPHLTDFLNSREQYILKTLIGEHDPVSVQFFGGYEDAERKRALLIPPYFSPEASDFETGLFHIDYPAQFHALSHGQIMGSTMALGLKREVFGDIITDGEQWQFFADIQLADFLRLDLNRIGKATVLIKPLPLADVLTAETHWQFKQVSVASLRLDAVISAAFNLSRQKAKAFVQADKIKLNWEPIQQPNSDIDIADVISVRGYGRIRLEEKLGVSRKGHLRVTLGVLDSNH